MSEVHIKFHNLDQVIFNNANRGEDILKEDFQEYLIKSDGTQVTILENNNLILCTFIIDKFSYKAIQEDHQNLLQIFRDENEIKTLFLEIKCQSNRIIHDLILDIKNRKKFMQYKGPLSYQPSKMPRTSLLSTESPIQNYRGFFNVLAIVLIVTHFRQIFEVYNKYGVFLNQISFSEMVQSEALQRFLFILLSFSLYILAGFYIQKLSFNNYISSPVRVYLNILNIMASCILPVVKLRYFQVGVIAGIPLLMISIVVFLKLISYGHVMRNCHFLILRIRQLQKEKQDVIKFINKQESNHDNLNILQKYAGQPNDFVKLKDLLYFMAAPTLCYQLSYPRTPRIRLVWLAKRIVEYIATLILIGYLGLQHLLPHLDDAYNRMQQENISIYLIIQVLLDLSIPNLYIWLLGFFSLFHCQLNILSEILKFGDRQFYLAWWNCKDLEEYWRLWNLPVHNWLIRHLYNPLLKRGYTKVTSSFIVFFVSAFFHEWIVSGALGFVSIHAFMAMMLQAPIIFIQKRINKAFKLGQSELGNVMFWISFCFIGQPMAIFLYYNLYRNSLIGVKN